MYVSIVNTIVIGSSVLQTRFGYTEVQAGYVFTLPYIVAACVCPFLGLFVARHGHRMTITIIGQMIMICSHTI